MTFKNFICKGGFSIHRFVADRLAWTVYLYGEWRN